MGVGMRKMQTSACPNNNPTVVLTSFLTRYARFTARFKDIFKPPEGTKVHFVVGNHDVG